MAAKLLPGETPLLALAGRFATAEQRIRTLLRRAPTGDRRRLLTQALAILLDLRRDAQGAGAHVEAAYGLTAAATALLTGRPAPGPERARELGRSLAVKLDRAAVRAEGGSRAAFATVTPDTLAEASQDAVTGLVDRAGNRRPLGAHAAMLTRTVGRHAASRAVADTADPESIAVHLEDTADSPCHGLAGTGQLPPYHPHCRCVATPAGVSPSEFVRAAGQTPATVP